MKSKFSQNAKILELLKSGFSLTPASARQLCRCERLAARIHALRKEGWQIDAERIGKGYARYSLSV